MKSVFTLFILLACASCSPGDRDGSDPKASKARLLGVWELVRSYDSRENQTADWGDANGQRQSFVFGADDTYVKENSRHIAGAWKTESRGGTYSVAGTKIVLSRDDEGFEALRVEQLTATELTVVWDYTGSDGLTYFQRARYERVG